MLHGGEIYGKKIEYDFSVNLNPYPCPKEVKNALIAAADEVNLYPDITQLSLRKAISSVKGDNITAGNIIGGNGASELLCAIIQCVKPKKVLLPIPSFYGYRHALNMIIDCETEEYQLRPEDGYELLEDFTDHIKEDTDLVIIANPNNPTGKRIREDVLEKLVYRCKEMGTAIVIDECFIDLTTNGVSAEKYVGEIPNLYIVNAFTKLFSIPGARIGYAVCSEDNICGIKRMLPEWNISVFAKKAAVACAEIIKSTDYIEESKELIEKEKKRITSCISPVTESDTNFVLVRLNEEMFEKLLKKEILIRDCSNFRGLEKGYYRIAIKDETSNDALIRAFSE